jgi:hypothetical protein
MRHSVSVMPGTMVSSFTLLLISISSARSEHDSILGVSGPQRIVEMTEAITEFVVRRWRVASP